MEFNTLSKPVLEPDHVYVFFLKLLQHVSKMREKHFELVVVSIYNYYAIIRPADVLMREVNGPFTSITSTFIRQPYIYTSLQWKKVFSYN